MDSPYFFEGTVYWSEGDERAHFEWLGRIPSIKKVWGAGRRVYLDIETASIGRRDMRELIGVYRRFGGDLAQLAALQEKTVK